MKLLDAYDAYKNNMVIKNQSYSTMKHLKYYRNKAVFFFGNIDVADLTLEDVTKYLKWLLEGGRCSNTVRDYAGSLRSVLKNVRLLGGECLNPDLIPVAPREEVMRDWVTPEEVSKMINSTSNLRTKLVLSLIYASGIRNSELCNLKISDIRGKEFTVKGKGKKVRLCFMDTRTRILLDMWLESRTDNDPHVIISQRFKTKVTPGTIQEIIKNARHRAGLRATITPHTFRHGFATDLLNNGAAIQDAARMLGHSNVHTTMIYFHSTDPGLREKYEKNHRV